MNRKIESAAVHLSSGDTGMLQDGENGARYDGELHCNGVSHSGENDALCSAKNAERIGLAVLYGAFFNVGLFTIGGAYAMIPVAQKALSAIYSMSQITEAFAVAQALPGVIAANTSAILGYQKRGILGAVAGVIGVITPSIIIITIIAMIFERLEGVEAIAKAFAGVRIGVLALLVRSAYELWRSSIKRHFALYVFVCALVLTVFHIIPAPVIMACAAFAGFLRWKYVDSRR